MLSHTWALSTPTQGSHSAAGRWTVGEGKNFSPMRSVPRAKVGSHIVTSKSQQNLQCNGSRANARGSKVLTRD